MGCYTRRAEGKIINLSKMVREDEDYQYVEGNPDQQASDQVLAKIIKKQMLAMRRVTSRSISGIRIAMPSNTACSKL